MSQRLAVQQQVLLVYQQSVILDKVIQDCLIRYADENRGRFRNFLLTVLDNYARNQHRDQHTRRRRPRGELQNLDDVAVSDNRQAAPSQEFEVAWARQVIEQTLQRMQEYCRASGRPQLWEVFQFRVLDPILNDAAPLDYTALVKRFGYRSPTEAYNALTTAKRIFDRSLRSVVSEYTHDDAEFAQELADLRAILSRGRA